MLTKLVFQTVWWYFLYTLKNNWSYGSVCHGIATTFQLSLYIFSLFSRVSVLFLSILWFEQFQSQISCWDHSNLVSATGRLLSVLHCVWVPWSSSLFRSYSTWPLPGAFLTFASLLQKQILAELSHEITIKFQPNHSHN